MIRLKIAAVALLASATVASATPPATHVVDSSTLTAVDTDQDGTIDMAEAKKAAAANFSVLDKDHDGTLDAKEAGMDITKADTDKDSTLDKAEFEASLTMTFKTVDSDHDGTVDAKELATADGQKLDTMIK